MKKTMLSIALSAMFLTACATTNTAQQAEMRKQKEMAVTTYASQMQRLQEVLFRLNSGAVSLCAETEYSIGATMASSGYFDKDLDEAAQSLFGLDGKVKALFVASGSPAERAGLKAGDRVLSLNDAPIADEGPNAYKEAETALKNAAKDGMPVRLTIARGGKREKLEIMPVKACPYNSSQIVNNNAPNAFTNGKVTFVTTGLLDLVKTEEELALVVAHELAHNAMGHIDAKKTNLMIGAAVDGAMRALLGPFGMIYGLVSPGKLIMGGLHSQDFEREADYVSMYAMELAGYDISAVPGFWRKMAAYNPETIKDSHWGTHPASPERMLLLEETASEIMAKKAAGKPLLPEKK